MSFIIEFSLSVLQVFQVIRIFLLIKKITSIFITCFTSKHYWSQILYVLFDFSQGKEDLIQLDFVLDKKEKINRMCTK